MSVAMHVVAGFVRMTRKARTTSVAGARAWISDPSGSSEPPRSLRRRHRVDSRVVHGSDVHTVTPRSRAPVGVVLYLHGGGYIDEAAPQHFRLVSQFADAGLQVVFPAYPLLPAHTAADAHRVVRAVYADLVARHTPSSVVIAGDSAGGGLAAAIVQDLLAGDTPLPAGLALISPWLDVTMSNPGIAEVAPRDPWLSPTGLPEIGRAWAGAWDVEDPRVSPARGTVVGLPPVTVWCGTRDVLHPEVMAFVGRIRDAGGAVDLAECPGGLHVYPLLPTPEGRHGRRSVVASVLATVNGSAGQDRLRPR